MQFPQFSSGAPLIILVCCLSVNDAVPFGSHPAEQVRRSTSSQPKIETAKTMQLPLATGNSLVDNRTERSTDSMRFSSRVNNQDDINENYGGLTKAHRDHWKFHRYPGKLSNKDNTDFVIEQKDPAKWEIPQKRQEALDNCVNEVRRQNQTYTRSIPSNPSINPAEDFKIAGEAEAKKTSSVHTGEDIALCWIETTTIKEDPGFNPPKRLVIREFTISFENSASIPDSHLECDELEGEIAPGDEDTVRKSALHEVIDENTKRSQHVNFTRVRHTGHVIVRQHKKVKCGVGAVVSKDIFEWPDGTDNPKKRVEIKIGPSIRDLDLVSDDRPVECTTKSGPERPNADHSPEKESSPDSLSVSCESGDCGRTETARSCEDDDCSTRNLSGETVPSIYSTNSNEVLSSGVTGGTTTIKPTRKKSSSPLITRKPERAGDDSCSEYDTDCMSSKATTVEPEGDAQKSETCSGEDCSGGSFDRSASEAPCDPSKDASCLCSGDNCASKVQSTSLTESSVEITTKNSELCNNNSESCTCVGTSCSIHDSAKPADLELGNKQTDMTTVGSVHGASKMITGTFAESSESRSSSQRDSGCDSSSGECSGSSQSYSDDDEYAKAKTSTTPLYKSLDNVSPVEQNRGADISDVTGVTEVPGTIRNASRTEIAKPCDEFGSEGCSVTIPEVTNISDEGPTKTEEDYSPIQSTSSWETTKEHSQQSGSDSVDNERSSSCAEGDEGCRFADTSNEPAPDSKPFDNTTDTTSEESEAKTKILQTSEKSETVTNRPNDEEIGIPITGSDREERTVKPSTESLEGVTLSGKELSTEESSVTKCSAGSGDCNEITVTTSSDLAHTQTVSSAPGETTLAARACESSGNCEITDGIFSSNETYKDGSTNSIERTKATSTCSDGDEACESPSETSNGSKDCEDGSTDCRSESISKIPESCDSASDSCSSESSDTDVTTMTQSTPQELEIFPTINDTVPTTAETRRSIMVTTPLSHPVKGRHRLALRIKVLLEHIDENKEKEQLVEVERHLLLDEKPSEHGNHSLTLQLQSLNNSMNFETLKSIFNCSALENLSKDVINLDKLSKDVINLKEVGRKTERKVKLHKKTVELPLEDSVSQADDDEEYDSTDRSNDYTSIRKKREILIPVASTTEFENRADSTTEQAILESLPGVQEDFQNGVDHVLSRISKELEGSTANAVDQTAESSSSKILKILSDPSDRRVHSTRPKRISRVGRVVSLQQLENPVIGEEIERWSKERFVSAADGGQIRSFTEFRILREHNDDSPRNASGL